MAVTTTKTNKPLNPRGNDQSPKGYNRAELYTGKALDFDGVNDDITIPNSDSINITGDALTIAGYINTDGSTAWQGICYKDGGNNKGYQLFVDKTGDPNIAFGVHTGTFYRLFSNEVIENNKWYFVVATYDGVNQSIYINGAFDNSQAVTGNISNSSTENLYIGRNKAGSERFNGEIAGFRIFNTALTAAQVADLYNNPEKIVPTGVADSALKLWLPMMEGAGTTAYNGAPDALGSELITNGNFETNSDWSLGSGSTISGGSLNIVSAPYNANTKQTISLTSGKTYIVNINATATGSSTDNTFQLGFGDSAGNPSNLTQHEFTTGTSIKSLFITASATDATIVFRSRDAGTSNLSVHSVSAKEITGVGTISGATWTHGIGAPVSQTAVINWNKFTLDLSNEVLIPQGLTAGRDLLGNLFENVRKQGALNLDGLSRASVHENASIDVSDCSLEAWVCPLPDSTSGWKTIFSKVSQANLQIYLNPSTSKIEHYSSATAGGVLSNVIFNANEWHHFVCVEDGSNMLTYVDGVLSTTKTISLQMDSDGDFSIGSKPGVLADEITAQIAQPRIYNRALTAEEVERNYNAGKNIYK